VKAGDKLWSSEPELVAISPEELAKYLTFNEGLRTRRYYDTRGFPTIGAGFNLARPGAKAAIEAVGADFDRIKSGEDSLTQSQVAGLLASDARTAIGIARSLFPGFDGYDRARQLILADLAFNLGKTKLASFKSFISAVNAGNWDEAAAALRKSKWFSETGQRAKRNVEALRTGIPPPAVL
jgi:GH24 family phage-related lysozyme (muramidase)